MHSSRYPESSIVVAGLTEQNEIGIEFTSDRDSKKQQINNHNQDK